MQSQDYSCPSPLSSYFFFVPFFQTFFLHLTVHLFFLLSYYFFSFVSSLSNPSFTLFITLCHILFLPFYTFWPTVTHVLPLTPIPLFFHALYPPLTIPTIFHSVCMFLSLLWCPVLIFASPAPIPSLPFFLFFLTLLLKNLYNHHSLSFFFPQLFKILIILVLPPLLNLLPSPSLVSCPFSSFLLYLAFSLPSRSRTPCS